MILNFPTPEDYSADPTGKTDSYAAIQACINATPNNGVVMILPGSRYKISQPLQFWNRSGLHVWNPGLNDTDGQGARGAEIIPAFTGAVDAAIVVNGSRKCRFTGIWLSLDVANPPACGWRVDTFTDPVLGIPTLNNTQNVWDRCGITPPTLKQLPSGTCTLVDIARTNDNNVDLMTFDNLILYPAGNPCAYYGVTVGQYNSKSHRFYRCSFTQAAIGVWAKEGSCLYRDCTSEACQLVLRHDNVGDHFLCSGWNDENCGQFASIAGGDSPALFQCCRIASPTGPYLFGVSNAGQVEFDGMEVYAPTAGKTVMFSPPNSGFGTSVKWGQNLIRNVVVNRLGYEFNGSRERSY